jgi:hypothetical protein
LAASSRLTPSCGPVSAASRKLTSADVVGLRRQRQAALPQRLALRAER